MSAGLVDVSGNVTDNYDATRLEDATVTLYPASGIVRDPVTITSLTYENGTLSWDAQIQPGNWIVVVDELGMINQTVVESPLDCSKHRFRKEHQSTLK